MGLGERPWRGMCAHRSHNSGTSGTFPATREPLALVLQAWTCAQVCTPALHVKKGMKNAEYLTMEVFLLGKPSKTKIHLG